jgi:hypothetical protein
MDPPGKFTARQAANASEKSYLDVFYITGSKIALRMGRALFYRRRKTRRSVAVLPLESVAVICNS